MKGYPTHLATKEDYKNIIRDFPQWRKRAIKELKALQAIKDDKVTRAIRPIDSDNPESDWITEEIPNLLPIYRQIGFENKKQLVKNIFKAEKKEKKEKKKIK